MRSRTYRFLSVAFRYPDLDITGALREKIDLLEDAKELYSALPTLTGTIDSLRRTIGSIEDVIELQVEYTRMFIGPFHLPSPPYESVYRTEWGGKLMGEAALHVRQYYLDEGLSLSDSVRDLPDHLIVELEFMSYLSEEEASLWQREAGVEVIFPYTKIYFPRMVIPLASVLRGVIDFLIAFLILCGLLVYYHFNPTANFDFVFSWKLLTLPLLLLLTLITALGVSLWFSAMNVIYRDVGYVLPFLTQLWFFITPIVYSSSEIKGTLRVLYMLNPMTGVVEGFRWALLGTNFSAGPWLALSVAISLITLISGLFYFRQMERTFADEI